MDDHTAGYVSLTILLFSIGFSQGRILRPCPDTYSSYYIADDTDPCVFYWCLNGELVSDGPMACAPGSGVEQGYEGEGNPCTKHLPGCKISSGSSHGGNQGHYGGGSSNHGGGYHGGSNQGQGGSHQGGSGGQGGYHHGGSKGGNIWIVPVHIPAPTQSPTAVPTHVPSSGGGQGGQGSGGQGSGGHGGHYAATAYLTQNAHVPGGQLQPHVQSLRFCWKACVYSFECKGFDYNTQLGTCWLHTDSTVCDTLMAKPYVNSYRLVHCPSTTPETSTTTTTMMMSTSSSVSTANPMKTPLANFTGMHLRGGTLQNGVSTLDDCFAACVADTMCQGVDFDTNGNTCWIHTMSSECGQLIAKPTCTHYRCVQCETPVAFPTAHAIGGTLIPAISDPTTCFAMCVGTCVAIDFDSATMTCWHHTTLTCAALEIKPQCVHFRRPGLCP